MHAIVHLRLSGCMPFAGLALGWSVTESICTRLINFYINARSLQFSWEHFLSAGAANLALVSFPGRSIKICLAIMLAHLMLRSRIFASALYSGAGAVGLAKFILACSSPIYLRSLTSSRQSCWKVPHSRCSPSPPLFCAISKCVHLYKD